MPIGAQLLVVGAVAVLVLVGTVTLLTLTIGSAPPAVPVPVPSAPAPGATGQPLTPTARLDVIRTALTVVAGVGGLVALVVAYRRQRLSESAEVREDTKLFTERFGAASEQLGHDKAPVRLAGVYALARLADDWADERQTCIDVLCAYLRMPVAADSPAEEGHVRDSAVKVIAEHLRSAKGASWSGRDFDLAGAVLRAADFSDCRFFGDRVSFAGVTFQGGATFAGAWFGSDAAVSFRGASFHGRVGFDEVTFLGTGASFAGALFGDGSVHFAGCTVIGPLDFSGASFAGAEVQFSRCAFEESTSLRFVAVQFLAGELAFRRTALGGAELDFSDADFRSGSIRFQDVEFDAGTVVLANSEFHGTDLHLTGCAFTGAHVDFTGSLFTGGTVAVQDPRAVDVPPTFDDPVVSAPGVLRLPPSIRAGARARPPGREDR